MGASGDLGRRGGAHRGRDHDVGGRPRRRTSPASRRWPSSVLVVADQRGGAAAGGPDEIVWGDGAGAGGDVGVGSAHAGSESHPGMRRRPEPRWGARAGRHDHLLAGVRGAVPVER